MAAKSQGAIQQSLPPPRCVTPGAPGAPAGQTGPGTLSLAGLAAGTSKRPRNPKNLRLDLSEDSERSLGYAGGSARGGGGARGVGGARGARGLDSSSTASLPSTLSTLSTQPNSAVSNSAVSNSAVSNLAVPNSAISISSCSMTACPLSAPPTSMPMPRAHRSLSLRSPNLFKREGGLRQRSTTLALTIPQDEDGSASACYTPRGRSSRLSNNRSGGHSNSSSPSLSSVSSRSGSGSSPSPESDSTSPFSGSSPANEASTAANVLSPVPVAGGGNPEENVENAYPEGPACVLEPNLFLYSEPTVEQLTDFDVIINVAQEITDQSNEAASSDVEYHFIPWTHNSKLVSDFPQLTTLIDDALAANKKVLIHCQCGISRSASLILAYFMKVNHCGYNEAYLQLKQKAPLISPNLGLIYELMEWGRYLRSEETADADAGADDADADVSMRTSTPTTADTPTLTTNFTRPASR